MKLRIQNKLISYMMPQAQAIKNDLQQNYVHSKSNKYHVYESEKTWFKLQMVPTFSNFFCGSFDFERSVNKIFFILVLVILTCFVQCSIVFLIIFYLPIWRTCSTISCCIFHVFQQLAY